MHDWQQLLAVGGVHFGRGKPDDPGGIRVVRGAGSGPSRDQGVKRPLSGVLKAFDVHDSIIGGISG